MLVWLASPLVDRCIPIEDGGVTHGEGPEVVYLTHQWICGFDASTKSLIYLTYQSLWPYFALKYTLTPMTQEQPVFRYLHVTRDA